MRTVTNPSVCTGGAAADVDSGVAAIACPCFAEFLKEAVSANFDLDKSVQDAAITPAAPVVARTTVAG